ncbi:MAG: GyrI-like domain-containing protein [Clostridia bacterium]|nr:GyrI-like domain-containing protein [Clostridia bacterium]
MIDIEIMDLPEIAVIGKEGLCTAEHNVVRELWADAEAHFQEIAPLGQLNPDGLFAGFWGAMSDVSRSFLPWSDGFSRGLYLAGLQVNPAAVPPPGWQKWTLPARRWLVADVPPGQYGEVFTEVLERVIPSKGLRLSGAVCDFTEPITGRNRLFFPVEEI